MRRCSWRRLGREANDGPFEVEDLLMAARRVACAEPCHIESGPGGRGTVWNVSTGGLYLVLDDPPAVGTSLQLAFSLPNQAKLLKAVGRIAWRNPASKKRGCGARAFTLPPGCGVEFTVIDSAARAWLERYDRMTRGR